MKYAVQGDFKQGLKSRRKESRAKGQTEKRSKDALSLLSSPFHIPLEMKRRKTCHFGSNLRFHFSSSREWGTGYSCCFFEKLPATIQGGSWRKKRGHKIEKEEGSKLLADQLAQNFFKKGRKEAHFF